MPNKNYQKGSINIPVIAAMAIVAVVTAAVSFYVTGKYYEIPGIPLPTAIVTPEPSPTATPMAPSPTPFVDETGDWKLYSSEEYGFELKHPYNWKSTSDVMSAVFVKNFTKDSHDLACSFIVSAIPTNNFDEYLKNYYTKPVAKETTTINGLNALKIENSYYIKRQDGKDFSYSISKTMAESLTGENGIKYSKDFNVPECTGVFDQILSTFKFTEKNGVASWKTYKNDKYRFEVKYPITWTAKESTAPGSPYLAYITFGLAKTIQQGGYFGLAIRNQTEDEYIAAIKKGGLMITNSASTTIGGKQATFYTFSGNNPLEVRSRSVIIRNNDFLFDLSRGADTNQENIFNLMLSTIKFTEPGAMTSKVKVFFINTNVPDNYGPIGCGDEAVGLDREITPTTAPLRAALENLLATSQSKMEGAGLYNSLAKQNWTLDSMLIINSEAIIKFSGKYTGFGACEDPRIKAQIEKTAMQFGTIKKVSIFVNGVPFSELLSGKGK